MGHMFFRAPALPASGLLGPLELAENLGLHYRLRDLDGRAALRVHYGHKLQAHILWPPLGLQWSSHLPPTLFICFSSSLLS